MPRSARNAPKPKPEKRPPIVEDQRSIDKILPRSKERGNPNIPIRTILYVEVQDFPANEVQAIAAQLLKTLPNEHPHYFVPLRYGKLTTDFEFEGEFIATVRKLCEIRDGEIVLKGGAMQVDVIRKKM